jgi:uncharacterized GH25 family protein
MRRLGPFLLLAVVAVLAAGAWLVLRPVSIDRGLAASRASRGGATSAGEPATPVEAGSHPERTADPTAGIKPPAGPNSIRGRVRVAADDRPAAGARVRAYASLPPLRTMKISQEVRRQQTDHPPAPVQDLSEFEPAQGGRQNGNDGAKEAAAGIDVEDGSGRADGKPAPPKEREKRQGPGDPLVTVTAKDDGTFEISGRSEKELHLDAVASGLVSDGEARVDFSDSPSRDGIVLTLVPGARLAGNVHDEEGRPVADATISLGVGFDPFSVFSSGGIEICVPAAARTDSQGAFLFEALPAPRSLQVQATAEGYATSSTQKLDLRPGAEHNLDLLLAHGATIVVHVTDETGAPAIGAKCILEPTRLDFSNLTNDLGRSFNNRLVVDADGLVRFTGVAAGEWRVRANDETRLDDSKKVTAGGPGSSVDVELRLTKGRTLTGVVVASDGTPIGRASVAAFVEPSLMNMSSMMHAGERRWQPADDEGRFTLGGLPDGKLVCEAHAKGYRDGRATVEKDAAECRIELSTRGAIEGVVVSKKTGKPVTRFDAKVVRERKSTGIFDPTASLNFIDVTVPFATPNGKFRLAGVNPGRLRLIFSAAEHGEQATDWLDVAEGEIKKGVVVFLEAEAVVEGTVVEAGGGAPVEGAGVERASGSNPLEAMMARIFAAEPLRSDAQGRFRIGGLSAGSTQFVASKEGFVEASSDELELAAGQTVAGVRIELARGGEIWGVVSDTSGAPQPGASLMCQEVAHMKMHSVKSDDKGEYHVKGLAAGAFTVSRMPSQIDLGRENFVSEISSLVETRSVRLKAGETMRIDFGGASRGGAALDGRVMQSGAPVAGALINVFTTPAGDAAAATGLKQATTAADGTFAVAGLTPGSGFVQVNGPEFGLNGSASAAAQPIHLSDGETTHVELVIPTGGLGGTVVDAATGAPLSGVAVYAASAEPGANLLELATRRAAAVHTDANGAFLVKHLRDGRYVLTAGATDLMSSAPADHAVVRTAPIDVADGRVGDVGAIRLPQGGRVEGTITDHSGKGLAGASVFLRAGGGDFLEEWTATTSDAGGRFAYGGVPNGVWDVVARAPGHAVAVARGVRVAEGSTAGVRLELLGGTEVFGDVGEVAVERLFNLKIEVEGPQGRIPLTLFGLGDLTDLLAHPPRPDVVRLGRFGPGDYRVHGALDGKSFEKKFTLKGEPELHIPLELPK